MKLEGEIGEINVVERLVELGREGFTGAVRFENDGIIKIIYFKSGDVLSASTNDRTDSVDEILLRAGKVTREHVKQALAKRKETETLGDALLGLGFITRKELTWARRVQVIGAIRSIEGWQSGSFTIVADYLPKREEGTIFPLAQVIVELIVTDPDRARFERALDGGEAVLVPSPDFHEGFQRLGLNQDAADIVSHLDGVSSAGEIANASGKDAFNVYKLLQALVTLGLASKRQAGVAAAAAPLPPPAPIDIPEAAPDLDFASDVMESDQTWRIAPGVIPKLAPNVEWPPAPTAAHEEPAAAAPVAFEEKAPEISSWDIHEPAAGEHAPPAVEAQAPAPIETHWGFDDAQIEAARRAAVNWGDDDQVEAPMAETVAKASRPNRWVALLLGSVAIIAIGFGGLAGWNWWQSRNASEETLVAPQPVRHAQLRPHLTQTNATTTSTATATTGSVAAATPPPAVSTSAALVPPAKTVAPSKAVAHATPAASTAAPVPQSPPSKPALVAGSMKITPAATASAPQTHPAASQKPAAKQPATKSTALAMPAAPSTTRVERNAAGNPTITNSGSQKPATAAAVHHAPAATAPAPASTPVAPGSDAMRSHYDEMAKSFASNPTGAYTLQFELVCQTASLTRAVRDGGSNVWFTPVTYHGQSCYRVFWGHYPSRAEAQAAKSALPASLSGSTPVVVAVPK